MKIWYLKFVLDKFERFDLLSLDNFELKDGEILLLFSDKFDNYSYDDLNLSDKIKLRNSPNLTQNSQFKISRSLKIYFEKNYQNIKNIPLYTSLSHSDNCAILAISTARVGVDLELIKDRNFSAHIDFCFSKEQRLRVANSKNQLIEFYKIWTLKEARIKLLNLGFYALDMASDESLGAFGEIIECSDKSFIYSVAIF